MITRLAHICIHTDNLTETERFYCEALSLEKGFTFEKDGDLFGFYIKLGEKPSLRFLKETPKV
jgi:catechol 2,3-dioxygenase-like lactoylglutathione lyase family enzyme